MIAFSVVEVEDCYKNMPAYIFYKDQPFKYKQVLATYLTVYEVDGAVNNVSSLVDFCICSRLSCCTVSLVILTWWKQLTQTLKRYKTQRKRFLDSWRKYLEAFSEIWDMEATNIYHNKKCYDHVVCILSGCQFIVP